MSARVPLALLLVTGCGFQSAPGTGEPIDAPRTVDASQPLDAGAPDASIAPFCIKNALVNACVTAPPTQPVTLSTGAIVTDPGAPMCAPITADSTNVCIVAGTSITVAAGQTVSAHGARPLVLLATGAITVTGTIDVAGHLKGTPQSSGPAVAACKNGGSPAQVSGGGAGGSFGSKGGSGGADAQHNPGGAAASATVPTALVGGCTGLAGNDTGGGGAPGKGGGAGGALGLFAKTGIVIDGVVNASGGGGGGATAADHGGGGGGTGGMIVLDAPSVTGGGKMFANGGSGGEGAGGLDGANGADPSDPATIAMGGSGPSSGGDGGNGAGKPGATAGAAGMQGASGGGGGGGGLGVIRLFTAPAVAATLVVSPGPK